MTTHFSEVTPMTSDRLSRFGRIMVDPWSTSFFEGREFRIFKELNIPASGSYVMKLVSTVNAVLTLTTIDIEAGFIRAAVAVGGTEGGSFSETFPIYPANSMTAGIDRRATYGDGSSVYTTAMAWTAGGTHTGGTETEVVRIKAGGNANIASSVGGSGLHARGLPPGTFYVRMVNLSLTDAITGVFRMRWEERP